MNGYITYFKILIPCCIFVFCEGQDPCINIKTIIDETRSVEYIKPGWERAGCDRFDIDEGWYTFDNNHTMPTTAPSPGQCGTDAPIWLNGTFPPKKGDIVSMTACKVGFFSPCETSWEMDVKNCGSFYIYYLKAIESCEGRYCKTSPDPCPIGTTSSTGFAPCENVLNVTLSRRPYISAFIPTFEKSSKDRILMFKCIVSSLVVTDLHDNTYIRPQNLFYDIQWLADEKEVKVQEDLDWSIALDGIVLKSTELVDIGKKMGYNLQCNVRVKMKVSGISSEYLEGISKYIGMKIQPSNLVIASGNSAEVSIFSTVPVACVGNESIPCTLPIEVFDFSQQQSESTAGWYCNESILELTKPSFCGLYMDAWSATSRHKHKLTIYIPENSQIDTAYSVVVKMRTGGTTNDRLWENFHLPEIRVNVPMKNVNDWQMDQKRCYSRTDPFLWTFDSSYKHEHDEIPFQDEGEFVLFRHRDKQQLEIHTIQRRFDLTHIWTENCAIAVRASADIFIIYGCGRPTKWIIRRLNCDKDTENLKVYKRYNEYEIQLPTGTIVRVFISEGRRLNIYIYLSLLDRGVTEGMCGIGNNDFTDDYTDRNGIRQSDPIKFARSWSVPQQESLFIAKRRKNLLLRSYQYCSCYDKSKNNGLSNKLDCSWQDGVSPCPPIYWDRTPCTEAGRIKRRSLDDDILIDVSEDVVSHKEHPSVSNDWKNGWNQSIAESTCLEHFKTSQLLSACSSLAKLNITSELDTCVKNIQISGSSEFISDSLDSILTECSVKVRLDKSLFNVTADDGTTLPDYITENNCPNDCKYNGVQTGDCFNGFCSCYSNYTGEACDVNLNHPPNVVGLSAESVCDLSKRPCLALSIFGFGFYTSQQFACRTRRGKLLGRTVEAFGEHAHGEAEFVNTREIRCFVTSFSGSELTATTTDVVFVSVTTNGIAYSDETPIIIYNSTCQDCIIQDQLVFCNPKSTVCIRNSACYPLDNIVCRSEEDEFADWKFWVIGISIFVLVIIAVAAGCFKNTTKVRKGSYEVKADGFDNRSQQTVLSFHSILPLSVGSKKEC